MIRPPEGQDLPEFLHFDPVPVKARRDGWTPLRQFRFILAIARGLSTSEAVRACGMTRASLYNLRNHPHGDSFARAWDAAHAFQYDCRRAQAAVPTVDPDSLLVPRFYRGRMVGFVIREDAAEAMRRLSRLDRIAASIEPSPASFDELLEAACAAAGGPQTIQS